MKPKRVLGWFLTFSPVWLLVLLAIAGAIREIGWKPVLTTIAILLPLTGVLVLAVKTGMNIIIKDDLYGEGYCKHGALEKGGCLVNGCHNNDGRERYKTS